MSETAHDELARLYETGLDTHLAQFDKRFLTCFETTAADGFIPSKKALARIYGKGLGVTPDLQKAKAMFKGLSKQEIKAVLDEIARPLGYSHARRFTPVATVPDQLPGSKPVPWDCLATSWRSALWALQPQPHYTALDWTRVRFLAQPPAPIPVSPSLLIVTTGSRPAKKSSAPGMGPGHARTTHYGGP